MALTNQNTGFSLVELSIVLVILGLLTGGILGGQALMRAAELRSVSNDVAKYQTAIYTFRDKYHALPGDMTNATVFWGEAGTGSYSGACPGTHLTPSTDTGTCNGNGNGQVQAWLETWRAWQHLANAGLIEGSYSGTPATASSSIAVPGVNCPVSKVSNRATYGVTYWATVAPGPGALFEGAYGNVIRFGANTDLDDLIISAEEAWQIDTKMDDGKPAYGKVRAYKNSVRPNCVTTDTPSTAAYDLANTDSIACNLIFVTGF